jgi:hypothetical protein
MSDSSPQSHLDAVALDGSPAQAFASHHARAQGISRYFALTHPLDAISGKADEDNTVALIAHLAAAEEDPGFAVPEQEASLTLAPKVLRRLNRGDGQVGTRRDYDMALKGLITIAYRYRDLIGAELDFLLTSSCRPGSPADTSTSAVTHSGIPSGRICSKRVTTSARFLVLRTSTRR